jgi:IS30 family transposase
LRRNAAPIHSGYYLPHKAHERALARNHEHHLRERLKRARLRHYVRQRLQVGWSPELIAGRWSRGHPQTPISHEAIYQWIYAQARELIPCLVRAHRKRQRRGYSRKHSKAHIPNRLPIDQRPVAAQDRQQAGHWEADTAVSRQSKAALQVSVERKTRFTKLTKLSRKGAREMRMALGRRLSGLPQHLRLTITYDNGSENAEHEKVNATLGTQSFFCQPYHSWERGTNENTIGLIRRWLPKKTNFAKIPNRTVKQIEHWLNHRPRKCLNFLTPAETLKAECCT